MWLYTARLFLFLPLAFRTWGVCASESLFNERNFKFIDFDPLGDKNAALGCAQNQVGGHARVNNRALDATVVRKKFKLRSLLEGLLFLKQCRVSTEPAQLSPGGGTVLLTAIEEAISIAESSIIASTRKIYNNNMYWK